MRRSRTGTSPKYAFVMIQKSMGRVSVHGEPSKWQWTDSMNILIFGITQRRWQSLKGRLLNWRTKKCVSCPFMIAVNKCDRASANNETHKQFKAHCKKIKNTKKARSCFKHDISNTFKEVMKQDMKRHSEENEIEGARHGIRIATYIGKLIKPTSAWEYSKSKYFQHYIRKYHSQMVCSINYHLGKIKYCKSQRTVNLAPHGIHLIQLIPFLSSIKNARWKYKDIFRIHCFLTVRFIVITSHLGHKLVNGYSC